MVHGQIFRLRSRGPAPRDRLNNNCHSHSMLTYPTDILPVVENRTIQWTYQAFRTTSSRSKSVSGEADRDGPPALADAENANPLTPLPSETPINRKQGDEVGETSCEDFRSFVGRGRGWPPHRSDPLMSRS